MKKIIDMNDYLIARLNVLAEENKRSVKKEMEVMLERQIKYNWNKYLDKKGLDEFEGFAKCYLDD